MLPDSVISCVLLSCLLPSRIGRALKLITSVSALDLLIHYSEPLRPVLINKLHLNSRGPNISKE